MRRATTLIALAALFAILQGNAWAEELGFDDQCRATIRAQIRGPACRKPQAPQQSDPCYISTPEAMKFELHDRVARCIDRYKFPRWQVSL
jgi:hypothetical protein